jgi:hypothetical protein
MEGVAEHLQSDEALAGALAAQDLKIDLSQAALSRKSLGGDALPRPVAEAIERLETRPKRERQTDVVLRGLRALRDLPAGADPAELARALLAQFPADAFALRLAEALAKHAGLFADESRLDALGRAIADRLPHALRLREKRLARLLGQKLDRLAPKRIALAGLAGGLGGAVVACIVLGVGGFATLQSLLSGRLLVPRSAPEAPQAAQPAPAPSSPANVARPPMLFIHVTQGSAPVAFDLQALLGAMAELGDSELGEKPVDNPIPSKPMPIQKPPPCLERAGEREIKGACYVKVADVKPPCGPYLFREGDSCFRAVGADPTKPVGVLPRSLEAPRK